MSSDNKSSSSESFSISLSEIVNNMSSKQKKKHHSSSSSSSCYSSSSSSSSCPSSSSSSCSSSCPSSSSSSSCTSSSSSSCSSSCSSGSSSYSSCPSSSSSSSHCSSSYSSSSCPSSSSSSSSCPSSSSHSSSSSCEKCLSNKCACGELSKKYKKMRECIALNKVALEIISFVSEKLVQLKPAMFVRDVTAYPISSNVAYIEEFFDKVLCVVTNNKLHKHYKITSCKLANNVDTLSNRLYTITIKSTHHHLCPVVIDVPFDFTLLTNNTPIAYGAVINITNRVLHAQNTKLTTTNLAPFL